MARSLGDRLRTDFLYEQLMDRVKVAKPSEEDIHEVLDAILEEGKAIGRRSMLVNIVDAEDQAREPDPNHNCVFGSSCPYTHEERHK
jgi:hypothetical protein